MLTRSDGLGVAITAGKIRENRSIWGLSSSTCCSFLFREHGDFPTSSFGNESGHSSFWGTVMLPRDFCGPGKHELQLPLCGSICRAPPVAGYRDGWES